MEPARYPLHLDVAGRRVLVVGGGPVAARRVAGLLEAGADVHVVTVERSRELPTVPCELRPFEPGDVQGAWLVLSCTGTVDAEVASACETAGVWCVRADDAHVSPAWVPAVLRREGLVVSVTAGGDPGRAVAVRNGLARSVDTGTVPMRRRRGHPGGVAVVAVDRDRPGLLTADALRALASADEVVLDLGAPWAGAAETLHLDVPVAPGDPGGAARRASEGAQVVLLVAPGRDVRGVATACARAGVDCHVLPSATRSAPP